MSAAARQVFLIGFMATGKSTVGRLLANELGRGFVDLDAVIEQRAERSIADIFASEGEAGFRQRESAALAEVIAGPPAVVATGGGAACYGENLVQMRASGLVVTLTASLETVRARAGAVGEPARPLMLRSPEQLAALLAGRWPSYRQAHACVDTDHIEPAAVSRRIASIVAQTEALPAQAVVRSAVLALDQGSYPVIVRDGALDELGVWIQRSFTRRTPTRLAVISDSNVAPLYAQAATRSLQAAGFECSVHVVPAGEESKCFTQLAHLLDEMVAAGLDRRSAVVALGGGVVGDLAGFAAACLYRGVACVQVPTTILAMVDSSIGGKTGIDIPAGKNLAGAFWQPRLVVADPRVLATLPVRERRAAFGEIVKYAVLDSEELLAQVDALAPVVGGDPAADADADVGRDAHSGFAQLGDVILRCASIKSFIVTRDEREQTGERALLNLGHTVGHAIEAAAGYGEILHGEAVALGLIATCRVSARLGLCPPDLEARVVALLQRAGLDVDLDRWLSGRAQGAERMFSFIAADKKRAGRQIGFIAIHGVGDCAMRPIDIDELTRILRA